MKKNYRLVVFAIVIAVALVPAGLWGQSEGLSGTDWPMVGGDWNNARYSELTRINRETVTRLSGAWISERFEEGAVSRTAPVVKDGLMFITAGPRVYALDAKTGARVWSWRSDEQRMPDFEGGLGGLLETLNEGLVLPAPHGVAVGDGRVFVGLMDGRVVALEQKTGKPVWAAQAGDTPVRRGQTASSAATYANGNVYVGLATGDMALRGRIAALDGQTGRKLWEFLVIPNPGDPGSETWTSNNHVYKQGGGGVWINGAFDPELGLVYFVTGNAYPEWGGEVRTGDNLFVASVVALDVKTGKPRWHYQFVHHDIWNADIRMPPVLYDAVDGGRVRKAIAVLRTHDSYLFFLDRENGKPISKIEERKVTQEPVLKSAPTQPFPVGADPLIACPGAWKDRIPSAFVLDCNFAPTSPTRHDVLAPAFSPNGPMSYSPLTGYFYAQGNAALHQPRRINDDPWFQFVGGGTGVALLRLPGVSVFAAIDSRTNKIVWKKELVGDDAERGQGGTGVMPTAGGLVFRGGRDGNFQAYDAKNGELLWQFQTGSTRLYPSATYDVDGEQYVALSLGRQFLALKLDGTVAPKAAPRASGGASAGPMKDVEVIETATAIANPYTSGSGTRWAMDEYAFAPLRARVKVGTNVTFLNNGRITHSPEATDGSWRTGPIHPAEHVDVRFDKPGTYRYICKDHPFSLAEIVVVP